jgi:hypothetical protein
MERLLDLTALSRDETEQLSESGSQIKFYSVSLTLSTLIKAAAAKLRRPHLA